MMTIQESIRKTLEDMMPELRSRYYVGKIGLFGSVTRSDFRENSDVDILVEFSKPVGVEFIDLAELLEIKLNRKVDLISRNGLKSNFFEAIKNKIVYV